MFRFREVYQRHLRAREVPAHVAVRTGNWKRHLQVKARKLAMNVLERD